MTVIILIQLGIEIQYEYISQKNLNIHELTFKIYQYFLIARYLQVINWWLKYL